MLLKGAPEGRSRTCFVITGVSPVLIRQSIARVVRFGTSYSQLRNASSARVSLSLLPTPSYCHSIVWPLPLRSVATGLFIQTFRFRARRLSQRSGQHALREGARCESGPRPRRLAARRRRNRKRFDKPGSL